MNRNTGAIKESHGSGVIVSDRGHVLTNYHVIDLGVEFIDRAYGGSIGSDTVSPMPMRLIDVEPTHDFALLQFSNTAMVYQAAPVGKVEAASAGSPVCSFGYLTREAARRYQQSVLALHARQQRVLCHGRLVGGDGDRPNIGIWLDVEVPTAVARALGVKYKPVRK